MALLGCWTHSIILPVDKFEVAVLFFGTEHITNSTLAGIVHGLGVWIL